MANNTIELTRLPNPTKHEQAQLGTLKDSFSEHKDVNMWSRNVDINTFRNNENTEAGFRDLTKGMMEFANNQVLSIQSQNETGDALDPSKKKSVWSKFFGMDTGIGAALSTFLKPFVKFKINLEDYFTKSQVADMSGVMTTWTKGTTRFKTALSELTNGIGAFGPIMNSVSAL